MSIMKKIMLMTAIALVALGSCKKETFNYGGNGADATGTLSFDGLAIEVSDETHQVKASTRATTDTYAIYVDSEDGQRFLSTTYNELKGSIRESRIRRDQRVHHRGGKDNLNRNAHMHIASMQGVCGLQRRFPCHGYGQLHHHGGALEWVASRVRHDILGRQRPAV